MIKIISVRAAAAALHYLLCCVVALLPVTEAVADPIEDTQTWANVTAVGHAGATGSPWRYWLEGQARFDDDSSRFGLGILRPGVGYALAPNTTLWLGYGYFSADPPGPVDNLEEHRIWQQLSWTAPQTLAGMTVSSRSRLEQRSHESGSEVGWRARQLFKVIRPLGQGPWSLVALDEIFFNLNATRWGVADGFDQNRAFAGLGLAMNSHTRAEVGYLNQFIAREGARDRMHHVISLNLFLNF
jgi:hypothetical protein